MPKFNIGVQFGIDDDGEFEGFNIAFGMSDFPQQLPISKPKSKKHRRRKRKVENVQYLLGEILDDDE